MDENLELTAKLKLDTTYAEKQLDSLTSKNKKTPSPKLDEKIKIPKETTNSIKELFSGDKGLKNVGKLAKSATGGVNNFMGSLSNVSNSVGAVAGAVGIAAAGIAVFVKLLEGTDTMKEIMSEVNNLFNEFRQIMAPLISIVGDLIITLIKLVEDILPLLEPIIDAISLSLQPLVTVLQLLEPIIRLLGEAFSYLYDIIKNLINTITFGLVDLNALGGSTTGLKQNGYKSSLDVWETSGETAEEKLSNAGDKLEEAAFDIKETFSNLFKDIGNIFTQVKDGLVNAGETAWNWIQKTATNVWDGIKNTATNVWDGFKNAVSNVGSAVSSVVTNVWDGAKNVASRVGEAVGGFFGKLKFWDDGGTLGLGAQIWGMNEKGNPEFLFNSGGTDTVINADILERAMYNAVKRANSEIGNREVKLNISGSQADARQLVKWLLPALKLELRS